MASELHIADAQRMEEGAVAVVKLPFRLRSGTHVNWFSGSNINVRLLTSHLDERSNITSAGVKTEVQGRYTFLSGRARSLPASERGRCPST